ncbi:MAG TPA: hypothetical protein PKU70_09830, partial [Vicinamibacteria bacterium]|nr:hypothetical protein [Vicinamibacteria bacterium]
MPSSTSGSRTLALGLGLALFAGSEWALWSNRTWARFLLRHEPSAASGDTFGVASRIRLTEPGAAPLLALLGSSVSREGLDCAILLRGFPPGGACVNLGIGGGAPLDMLYISRELGPAPRTVVIAIFPGILSKAPKSGFIDSLTIRAVAESGAWPRASPDDWRRMGSGLLQTLSPTLRHREGLRDAFRERAQAPREDPRSDARRTSDEDRKPPEYFANRVGRIDPDLGLSRFAATQEMGLDWLIAQETRAGHRTVVVDFPTRPGFETTLAEDVRARYASLLARLKSRSDILFVEATALGPLAEGD